MPARTDFARRRLADSYGRCCSHLSQDFETDRFDTFVGIQALQTLARYIAKKALYPRFESLVLHLKVNGVEYFCSLLHFERMGLSQKQFEFNLQFVLHFDCSTTQLDRFNAEIRLREFRMSRRPIRCIRQTRQ